MFPCFQTELLELICGPTLAEHNRVLPRALHCDTEREVSHRACSEHSELHSERTQINCKKANGPGLFWTPDTIRSTNDS